MSSRAFYEIRSVFERSHTWFLWDTPDGWYYAKSTEPLNRSKAHPQEDYGSWVEKCRTYGRIIREVHYDRAESDQEPDHPEPGGASPA